VRVLTILGTSASLPSDIASFGVRGDVMAVNRAVVDYPWPILHAVSVHDDLLNVLMEFRAVNRRNVDGVLRHSDDGACPLAINTSGLYALWLSQQLDYDLVRVLGLSADTSGHYYDIVPEVATGGPNDFLAKFPFDNEQWLEEFKGWTNVRVSSGNLLRLFHRL
jgi:hypothetical protein